MVTVPGVLTERGQRDTLYDIRKLLTFADAVDMPRAALLPLILGQPDAILESDNTVALRGVDTVNMDRRGFTALAGGLAASAVLPAPARADRAHVRYLQSTLTQLRAQDRTVGGGALLPQALRHFAHARRVLDESDHTAAIGRELLIVTADLGIQSAWFAYDANNSCWPASYTGRRRCWPTALVSASGACTSTQIWRSSPPTWLMSPAVRASPAKR